VRVTRRVFPQFNRWLQALPDPRRPDMCVYAPAHLWWTILVMFLARFGSRHGFDQERLSGAAPHNFGALCGQGPEDPRFAGSPRIACSDTAAGHADRVAPRLVARLLVFMIRVLLRRRLLEPARLFDRWYLVVVDGTVKEKCRRGFSQGGKKGSGQARYRYVMQASIIGPGQILYPVMHEEMDLHHPATQKEDCELASFRRLSRRLKAAFPRLPICLVADALYGCQTVIRVCEGYGWKYVLTLKPGRQPTTWQETIRLLPLHRQNRSRLRLGQDGGEGLQDFRWVEAVMLGAHTTNVILSGCITPEAASLYAFVTNFAHLNARRVEALVNQAGRERHLIEDTFNTQKNHGIGLEHVFCAEPQASKNYYTMMQVAQILWNLICHGYLKPRYEWAREATQMALARAIGKGMVAMLLPRELPPVGQLRFGFT